MSNEFQGTLFATRRAMLDAVACEWITAGGQNHSDEIDAACGLGAAALADECIRGWGLVDQIDDSGETWLARRDCTRDDLEAAFSRFIADRPDTTTSA